MISDVAWNVTWEWIATRYHRDDEAFVTLNSYQDRSMPGFVTLNWGKVWGRICDVEEVRGSILVRIYDVEQAPRSPQGRLCDVEHVPGSMPDAL